MKQYWWWDDFFAIISLPIQITLLSLMLVWRNIGLGQHADTILAENPLLLLQGAKYLYIATFIFDCSITFPKLSAIFFYARVFRSNNKLFKINLWIAGCLVTGWLVAAAVSTIFQCTPIKKAWNPILPGTCINTSAWYLATSAISVVIDFYILLLPVPMIWALKMSLKRRLYLLGAFFLAYSVIVLSIGRLVSISDLFPSLGTDLTWNVYPYLYWVGFEGAISLISISVPNIVGLVKTLRGRRCPGNNLAGGKKYTGPISTKANAMANVCGTQSTGDDYSGFQRLSSSECASVPGTDGQRGLGPTDGKGDALELRRIRVQTHISVSKGTYLSI
ncbi:hypothetical protein F4821DRAFT_275245 [Hypoxylon rubiginosum]|uniref:Uncharacterized protein n=1 Tax=Hypoxylon rubiginosum TaxID=110542 RepID=A0ACC0DCA7_9PEZI|nr:hypothetical protein F4821DRAFT_275245 [Hypoxylon rubiginosum]